MKKLVLFALAVLGLALAAPANAGLTGKDRWQNNAGIAAVDTLNWSDQGAYSLRDTLVVATPDTTTGQIDIAGCSEISLWIIASGLNAPTYHNINYQVGISPDNATWINFGLVASTMIKAGGVAADTTVFEILSALRDSTAATVVGAGNIKRAIGRDQMLALQGEYLRVIAIPSGGTTGDTTIVKAILRREWPADPK